MDKKYNGFNNGRDRSDGVGGREVNHGKQETMTKEQILEKHAKVRIFDNLYTGNEIVSCQCVLPAMEEYAQQKVAAERERAGKLVEALQKLAWHLDTLKAYHLVESIKQTLNEYDTATKEPGTH